MEENEIAAVRRIRHEISKECNLDVERVIAYFRSVHEEFEAVRRVPIREIRDFWNVAGRANNKQS